MYLKDSLADTKPGYLQSRNKRTRGEYYTEGNPFTLQPFLNWSKRVDLTNQIVLEPFAGANNIIESLRVLDLCKEFESFDVNPTNNSVLFRNTLEDFPQGYEVCVTNPPWLARNSATRRGLKFPTTTYDDLYKQCLELCLQHCPAVAALIPASFLHSKLFRDRLETYVLLHDRGLFNDTDNPVCLALFGSESTNEVHIYYDDEYVGELTNLERMIPVPKSQKFIRFNDVRGELGFIAFDNTLEPTIRFCRAADIVQYPVKVSSRFFTRIYVENNDFSIERLNSVVKEVRESTKDLFLTPFKGLRKDGRYRRRMSFADAKILINAT